MRVGVRRTEPGWVPSTYFGQVYGRASALHAGAEWVTVADDDGRWQMPLVVRRGADGVVDASTPYGYGGIHIAPDLDAPTVDRAWAQTMQCLTDLGVVSVFLRFSPFMPDATAQAGRLSRLDLAHRGDTVCVNLADLDLMWSRMEGRARTAVRKAEASGFAGSVDEIGPHDLASGSAFRHLYAETMDRLEAADSYYFSDDYFAQLCAGGYDRMRLVTVRDREQDVVAAAVMLLDERVVHYHLSASRRDAARLGANNLLIWTMLTWAAEHGHEAVHLGGGLSADDGLYKFKRSFGGERTAFFVGRLVVDTAQYDALVDEHAASLGCPAAALRESDFFPAYRAVPAEAVR